MHNELKAPGGHFVTEQFLAHHGRSVARWKMLSGEGLRLGEGASSLGNGLRTGAAPT